MVTRLRLPMPAEEKRKRKAVRQKRWRDGVKAREAADAAVNYSLGIGPKPTAAPIPQTSDLASMLRDRYIRVVGAMSDEDLLNKDFAASLTVGLKANAQIEAREKQKTKQGNAELAFAIIEMLTGGVRRPIALIADPSIVDGAYEVLGDDPAD